MGTPAESPVATKSKTRRCWPAKDAGAFPLLRSNYRTQKKRERVGLVSGCSRTREKGAHRVTNGMQAVENLTSLFSQGLLWVDIRRHSRGNPCGYNRNQQDACGCQRPNAALDCLQAV